MKAHDKKETGVLEAMTLISRAKPTMTLKPIHASDQLKDVRCEVRGPLARCAYELELAGEVDRFSDEL